MVYDRRTASTRKCLRDAVEKCLGEEGDRAQAGAVVLGEGCPDRVVAGVGMKDRAEAWVKMAETGRREEGRLHVLEGELLPGPPNERSVVLEQGGERGGSLCEEVLVLAVEATEAEPGADPAVVGGSPGGPGKAVVPPCGLATAVRLGEQTALPVPLG